MYSYDPYAGWWPSSWWNSAATLTALIDHGDRQYDWVIARTFDQNKGTFAAGQRGTDPIEGNFISRAIDDSAWWGLAWVAAYDHTGDQRYLTMATTIANYVQQYWDPGTCGGGVWWDRERTYKNSVTSGLYLRLAASIHRRTPGDTVWLQKQFKGIFSRYLADLAAATGTPAYQSFAQRQADSIWSHDCDPLNQIGQRWAGGSPNPFDWRTQASGLGALNGPG
jgi:predicted alpha-1,6-mannanase (GH76 family)